MTSAATPLATGASTPVVVGSQVTVHDVAAGEILTYQLLAAPAALLTNQMQPLDDEDRLYHHEWVRDSADGQWCLTIVNWVSDTPPAGTLWHHLRFQLVPGGYLLPGGCISQHSPLGAALLGCREGDLVPVHAPAGTVLYQVLLVVSPH